MYTIGAIFLVEVILSGLVFAFSQPIQTKVTDVLQNQAIQLYQNDPDLKNLIDWIQAGVSFIFILN